MLSSILLSLPSCHQHVKARRLAARPHTYDKRPNYPHSRSSARKAAGRCRSSPPFKNPSEEWRARGLKICSVTVKTSIPFDARPHSSGLHIPKKTSNLAPSLLPSTDARLLPRAASYKTRWQRLLVPTVSGPDNTRLL